MNLSPDRQNHLANVIVRDLMETNYVSVASRDILFSAVKKAFSEFVREWEEMDKEISYKISSIKRGIHPGSSEWEALYSRFFEEIFRKKSRLFVKK